jgi:hypothetical protein
MQAAPIFLLVMTSHSAVESPAKAGIALALLLGQIVAI